MSRTITGAMAAQLALKQIAPVFFVEMDFLSGFVRMWNGLGTLSWNGQSWLGGGQLMSLSQVEETREIEATTLSMSLSAVDPVMVSVAYGDFSQGRPAKIWLGLIDVASGQVVSDPVAIFQGRMDTISDEDSGESATITVSAESNLADLRRLRARFFTDQDQQRLFSNDRSFRFIPSIQDRNIFWGAREGSPQIAQNT